MHKFFYVIFVISIINSNFVLGSDSDWQRQRDLENLRRDEDERRDRENAEHAKMIERINEQRERERQEEARKR